MDDAKTEAIAMVKETDDSRYGSTRWVSPTKTKRRLSIGSQNILSG